MTLPVLSSLPLSWVLLNLEFASLWTLALPWTPCLLSGSIPCFQHPLYRLMSYSHSQKHLPEPSEPSLLTRSNFSALSVSSCPICLWSIAEERLSCKLMLSSCKLGPYSFLGTYFFNSFDWNCIQRLTLLTGVLLSRKWLTSHFKNIRWMNINSLNSHFSLSVSLYCFPFSACLRIMAFSFLRIDLPYNACPYSLQNPLF